MKKFSDLWGQATEAAALYIHLICLCKNEANCEGRNIKKCWGMVALHYHYSHLHTRHFMMPPDIFWCILTPPLFQSLQKEVRFRQPRYASHNRIFMRKKTQSLEIGFQFCFFGALLLQPEIMLWLLLDVERGEKRYIFLACKVYFKVLKI